MTNDTQTAYALAIAFGLVDEATRSALGSRLAEVVRRDGYHIATGLVGTAVIMDALSSTGHHDAASRLLLQTESPSWLFPVTVGATTVWERWDGLQADGTLNPGAMVSFNHVALGSVAAWLHEAVAGLRPSSPGYASIVIAPTILPGLDHASATHRTPYGEASAGWQRTADGVRIHATIPSNTSAEVVLPDGRTESVSSGPHSWLVAPPKTTPRSVVTLDSSMAALADSPAAYQAFYAALDASPNRFVARAIRSNAVYRSSLAIRDALVFADSDTLAAVDAALVAATTDSTD